VDRERIDNWCEKVILGLVLAVLVAGPLALGGVRPWGFLLLQGLTMVVMVAWGLRLWISPKPTLLWPPICWAVLAFVIYAIARCCTADIEIVARKELLRVLVYAFLFYAILNNLHRQESTQIIALTLVFLAMALSGYAIFQFVTKSQRIWWITNPYYPGRGTGTYIYPNQFAGFLEMIIPLGLCMVLMGRYSHLTKILIGYAVAVMLAGVGVTFSRGGWLVTGVIMIATCGVLLLQRDYRLKALALLAVLLVSGLFLVPKVTELAKHIRKPVEGQHNVDDMRFSIWWSAIRMWQDHPWWGVGPGHFDYRYTEYRLPNVQPRAGYVHNDYLNTLVDWGAVGAALVAAAWLLVYWGIFRCWKHVRGARDDFSRKKSSKLALMTGAALGLGAILIHSLVDFNMQMPANAILAITLMALLSSQWRFATDRYWVSAGVTIKCLATLLLVAGLVELGRMELRGAQEWKLLNRAEKTPNYTFARIAALEKAFEVEPHNFETAEAIGDCYKTKSFLSESDDPIDLARKAMTWYERAFTSNRYDAYSWMRYGMCQDWIGLDDKGERLNSAPYYARANELDPNGFFTTANTGWHYLQIGDYAAARTWLERSERLQWNAKLNEIAPDDLPIVERRLREGATEVPLGRQPPATEAKGP
jgi:O-antigen ligase